MVNLIQLYDTKFNQYIIIKKYKIYYTLIELIINYILYNLFIRMIYQSCNVNEWYLIEIFVYMWCCIWFKCGGIYDYELWWYMINNHIFSVILLFILFMISILYELNKLYFHIKQEYRKRLKLINIIKTWMYMKEFNY